MGKSDQQRRGPGSFVNPRDSDDEAKRKSEALERLFDAASIVVINLDIDGRVTGWNKTAERVFGWTEDEVLGEPLPIVPETEIADLMEMFKKQMAGDVQISVQRRRKCKDGSLIDVSINSAAYMDESGKPAGFVGVIQDITERKRAEEEVRRSEERLRQIIDLVPHHIFAITTEGRFLFINQALADVYGMKPGEVVGKTQRDITPVSEEEEHFLEDDREVVRTGKKLVIPEEVYTDPSGREHILRTVKIPFTALGTDKPAVLGICEDITEQKLTERELERARKLDAVGVLAGGIAHDFNNILTAILGNVDLVLDSGLCTKENLELLEEAKSASLRAHELANQLLTFSKGGTPVRELVDFAPCIRDTVTFTLRGSNVSADVDLADDLWKADIDAGQISQVIHNLVINAMQSMPEGGRIAVSAANLTGPEEGMRVGAGRYVLLRVTDTGEGIPEDVLDRVFDPYFTTKDQGSGLGLTTCYAIVQKHDGNIWVESSLGEGTAFFVALPAAETGHPIAAREDKQADVPVRGSGRLLIMDDEAGVRDVAKRMLERWGYEVDVAADGDEAEALYRAARDEDRPYSAVVLDLTIPGARDGLQTLDALREIDPDVAAVMTTGYSHSPAVNDYRAKGVAGFVPKPYEVQDLAREVQRMVALRNRGAGGDEHRELEDQ